MIRIRVTKEAGEITSLVCQGHAGYAEEGHDIVCAAVSVLAFTCANALESVAHVKAKVEERDGFLSIYLPPNAGHDAQTVMNTVLQGFRDLNDAYPKYLQLKEN
ncbi:MAG: ribosomal-processing cysteine protease Prp [Clostridia bacterium]|nr:ribosomal-processing cysteine protease Prp [Clostridia bacterium]